MATERIVEANADVVKAAEAVADFWTQSGSITDFAQVVQLKLTLDTLALAVARLREALLTGRVNA